jgi:hypothetical protein
MGSEFGQRWFKRIKPVVDTAHMGDFRVNAGRFNISWKSASL